MSREVGDLPYCPSYEALAMYAQSCSEQTAVDAHVQACPSCEHEVKLMREDAHAISRYASFLIEPRPDAGTAPRPHGPSFSAEIDGYVLAGEIARGAQGIVYRAVQRHTNRTVAIKVLREGLLGSSKARARFDREVEIVAGLHHPNIVTLHQSLTVGGSQALVMEYVDGVPMANWATKQGREAGDSSEATDTAARVDRGRSFAVIGRHDVRARLSLFLKICDAVAHAHQQGVIHRDLKPSNILVDAAGEPRLLDFGIAKPLVEAGVGQNAATTPGWENTQTGEFAGTLAYASPEQVAGDSGRIGTSSDVYSLGVVLYEFLTGLMPYPIEGTLLDVARRIENTPPVRASTVCDHIDSDLDAILTTALQKDPARRYASAGSMKDDIERFLLGEPLLTKRTHTGYVVRKWMWRHKAAVIGICAVLCMLVGATIVAVEYAVQASDAEEVARLALATEVQRSELLERQAYVGHIFAAQEALVAMDAAGVIESVALAAQAPESLKGWEWQYLNARINDSDLAFTWSWAGLHDGDMSQDGRWAAVSTADGVVRVWDLSTPDSTGHPALEWRADFGNVAPPVAISPDARLIAASHETNIVRFMDRESGGLLPLRLWHPSRVLDIDFSFDGKYLITSCESGSRHINHIESGHEEPAITEPSAFFGAGPTRAHDVATNQDGRRLVTAFANDWIVMRDAVSGKFIWKQRIDNLGLAMLLGAAGRPRSQIAISDDGRIVASGHRDGNVRIWDGDTGKPTGMLSGHRDRYLALAFVPGSHDLLVGSGDGLVRRWDTDTQTLRRTYFGLDRQVVFIACTRGSPPKFLAGASSGASRMWRLDAPEAVLRMSHQGKPVKGAVFSSSGETIYTIAEHTVHAWDTSTGGLRYKAEVASTASNAIGEAAVHMLHQITSIVVVPRLDEDWIVTTHVNGSVKRWSQGQVVATIGPSVLGTHYKLDHPAVSSDGKHLLVGLKSDGVAWCNLDKTAKPVRRTFPHADVCATAFTPDGAMAVVLTTDSVLTLLDAHDISRVRRRHTLILPIDAWEPPTRMCFSPDGTLLAIPNSREIVVFDTRTLEPVFRCAGHTSRINSARFSPDGSRLVSASDDTTVRLWDARTGERRLVLRQHDQPVLDATFNTDGKLILSCSIDGHVLVWNSKRDE